MIKIPFKYNLIRKIKNITVFFLCVFLSFQFTSCVKDDLCKYCRAETRDSNNHLVSAGPWQEYCGSDLKEIEGETSTVGDLTTRMVCK